MKMKKNCARCKDINECDVAKNVKQLTGLMLKEMLFYCFRPKKDKQ